MRGENVIDKNEGRVFGFIEQHEIYEDGGYMTSAKSFARLSRTRRTKYVPTASLRDGHNRCDLLDLVVNEQQHQIS
jgi:hypothetical protein